MKMLNHCGVSPPSIPVATRASDAISQYFCEKQRFAGLYDCFVGVQHIKGLGDCLESVVAEPGSCACKSPPQNEFPAESAVGAQQASQLDNTGE